MIYKLLTHPIFSLIFVNDNYAFTYSYTLIPHHLLYDIFGVYAILNTYISLYRGGFSWGI